ncbi:MAG TPA: hypothetical protein VNW49_04470, partial [Puia sp.]|nr:hypothetical protein [Puia sp.]
MQRRKFLQVSGFSAVSFLFTRFDPISGNQMKVIRFPDAVSVRCSGEWISLTGSTETWKHENVQVKFELNSEVLSLFVDAPGHELEFIKCSWKQAYPATSKFLTDQWERSYGDLSWESPSFTTSSPVTGTVATTPAVAKRSPWYLLISDGVLTQAYGVKTGANSFCSWQISAEGLELILDTNSGGAGVLLGERTLHAADI